MFLLAENYQGLMVLFQSSPAGLIISFKDRDLRRKEASQPLKQKVQFESESPMSSRALRQRKQIFAAVVNKIRKQSPCSAQELPRQPERVWRPRGDGM